ncbi:MAG: 4Fe-4S binding protein [Acidimicrobiia bacterium]|nr:4Fe-4S binding protein [Acidimicrobiia bacterium]
MTIFDTRTWTKLEPPKRQVEIVVDGNPVSVPEDATILDACRQADVDVPTMCFGENLTARNACRACVVEVEGERVLAPSCSRQVDGGMVVSTDSDRVQTSRKVVLELLASSVDLSLAGMDEWMDRYGADRHRYGPPGGSPGDPTHPGHHTEPDGTTAAAVAQDPVVDNDLYVRDLEKCILCYQCVDACGVEAQNTFAITVAGRGFDARIATEFAVDLGSSACVFCGNCVGVCPTGALMGSVEFEMRADETWSESDQTVTRTVCSFCGVGCNLDLHVQDNRVVKVTSPGDHSVTDGHLCIKGRFGWEHIQ